MNYLSALRKVFPMNHRRVSYLWHETALATGRLLTWGKFAAHSDFCQCSLKHVFSIAQTMAFWMTRLCSGKDDKANCLGLIFNVIYQHFSDRPQLATKIYHHSWTLDWDQNSDPPKYTSGIPKCWYLSTKIHGITSEICISSKVITMKTSDLVSINVHCT